MSPKTKKEEEPRASGFDLSKIQRTLEQRGNKYVKIGSDTLLSDITGRIPTGITFLDASLEGGIPVGRMVEVFGAESCGKTTLMLAAAAQCQRMGGVVIYLDTEESLHRKRSTFLGVDFDKIISQEKPQLESGFRFIYETVKLLREQDSEAPILVCWDTLAASPSENEYKARNTDDIEKAKEKYPDGRSYRPRLIGEELRTLHFFIAENKVALIIANHIYGTQSQYGLDHETPGGRSIKFYSSARLFLQAGATLKEGDDPAGEDDKLQVPVGKEVKFTLEKNKLSMMNTFRSNMYFAKGFDDTLNILEYLQDRKFIPKAASWTKIPTGEKLPDGEPEYKSLRQADLLPYFQENPQTLVNLKKTAVDHYNRNIPW